MRFESARRLLALAEELDWMEEQGYGNADTWRATHRIQEMVVDEVAAIMENTIIPAIPPERM